MKVLWLCNIILPQIAEKLLVPQVYGGGWLSGLSDGLLNTHEVELTVCFPLDKMNKNVTGKVGNLSYIGFKNTQNNLVTFTKILRDCSPDVIHIFGTEKKHTFDMVLASEQVNMLDRTAISIQGLISVYAKHYFAELPYKVIHSWTFRDLIRISNIKKRQKRFIENGKYEIEVIRRVKQVIGRTEWDFACSREINKNVQYYFCNETLRKPFYENEWNINVCEKHTIFISQCSCPIKGFHKLLEAIPAILSEYPDAHIYTTGRNPIKKNIKSKLLTNSYEVYLKKMIRQYVLAEKITFLGNLDAESMCDRYLKSHVFVLPSAIENSPNSLGEAMILGVPCVSSDVGGVKDMMEHGKEGFVYPFDEPYMIAHYVNTIFSDDKLAKKLSRQARKHATVTHSKSVNNEIMMDIYQEITTQKTELTEWFWKKTLIIKLSTILLHSTLIPNYVRRRSYEG